MQTQQGGTVTGVLKDNQGTPVAGTRMTAIARAESLDEVVTSPAMSSLAETDEQGRYTLESIPPGRYFIAAGRLDAQTYYPGTSDIAMAKEVIITPGSTISGIDFTLDDSSFGRANAGGVLINTVAIPLQVTIEGGGKMPVSAGGKLTSVKLDMGGSSITTPIGNTSVSVPGPQTTAYHVTVENLPETYAVKSIMYGTTDLLTNTLRLTPANFGRSIVTPLLQNGNGTSQVSPPANPAAGPPPASQLPGASPLAGFQFGVLPQDPAGLQAYLAGLAASTAGQLPTALAQSRSANGGATSPQNTSTSLVPLSIVQFSGTPPSPLFITLSPVAPKTTGGARISGRMNAGGARTVYVSGIPGNVYSDGTFDVYGIPPGRHSIVTGANPAGSRPLVASVVVDDNGLDNIVLEETAVLPINASAPAPARPAGGRRAGNIPLAQIKGTLVEELSGKPITEGAVIVKANGNYSASFPIDGDGHFELPPLLPGTYELEVQVFGHSNTRQSVDIDDKDLNVELVTRKLY